MTKKELEQEFVYINLIRSALVKAVQDCTTVIPSMETHSEEIRVDGIALSHQIQAVIRMIPTAGKDNE